MLGERIWTIPEAEEELRKYAETAASRDLLVLRALEARLPKTRIRACSGIALTTIDRIERRAAR